MNTKQVGGVAAPTPNPARLRQPCDSVLKPSWCAPRGRNAGIRPILIHAPAARNSARRLGVGLKCVVKLAATRVAIPRAQEAGRSAMGENEP